MTYIVCHSNNCLFIVQNLTKKCNCVSKNKQSVKKKYRIVTIKVKNIGPRKEV